jgi:ribosomal protein S18 acetylase RimI-like enzyme
MPDPFSTQGGNAVAASRAKITPEPAIRNVTDADIERCLEVLTLAFENDPPSRWLWPDRQQYLDAFPRFARAFGGGAIDRQTAYCHEGFAGVALWLPPGAAADEDALVRVIRETAGEDRTEQALSLFEQMGGYHPGGPHWHLPLIGVDPASQGRGVGSALLRHMLDQCDRQKELAYLEATSPRNVALYQRHGFEALGRVHVADSPAIVPMLRRPR